MKKVLMLLLILVFGFSALKADAKKPDVEDISIIGFKILESNKINKRMVFKYNKGIKSPRISLGYKPENTGLVYTDRTIWVYGDAMTLVDDENELAGLLSHAIALGENSYTWVIRGFFSEFNYKLMPLPKESRADLKAADYMVKAGYNPVALIVIYNKTLGQTRFEWCHYYPIASKRMMNIYTYIYEKYPQFLSDNAYADNIYYKNFLMNSTKEMDKFKRKGSR